MLKEKSIFLDVAEISHPALSRRHGWLVFSIRVKWRFGGSVRRRRHHRHSNSFCVIWNETQPQLIHHLSSQAPSITLWSPHCSGFLTTRAVIGPQCGERERGRREAFMLESPGAADVHSSCQDPPRCSQEAPPPPLLLSTVFVSDETQDKSLRREDKVQSCWSAVTRPWTHRVGWSSTSPPTSDWRQAKHPDENHRCTEWPTFPLDGLLKFGCHSNSGFTSRLSLKMKNIYKIFG